MHNVDNAELRRLAGERAAELVASGTIVGLGHGRTALFAVRRIAQLLDSGRLRDIRGVPRVHGYDLVGRQVSFRRPHEPQLMFKRGR